MGLSDKKFQDNNILHAEELNEMVEEINKNKQNISTLNNQIINLNDKDENVENEISELKTQDDNINERLNSIDNNITSINDNFDNTNQNIENLEEELDNNTTSINNNTTLINEINTRIDNLEDEITLTFLGNYNDEEETAKIGRGLCAILKGANYCYVFDLGHDVTLIAEYLRENEIKVDGIIISHFHNDHIGTANAPEGVGLTYLIDSSRDVLKDECIYYFPHNATEWDSTKWSSVVDNGSKYMGDIQLFKDAITRVNTNENKFYSICDLMKENINEITINDNTKIKFYNLNEDYFNKYRANDKDYTGKEGIGKAYKYNNFSMISIIEHYDNKIAITGDIEYLAEKLNAHVFSNIDVLQIEHHNENRYSNPSYLDKLNPKIAIIPTSTYFDKNQRFRPTTTQIINSGGKVYYTGDTGNIEITSTKTDIFVSNEVQPIRVNNSNSYSLTYGEEPYDNDFDNLLLPGVYTFYDFSTLNEMANKPERAISGGKLIVEDMIKEFGTKKQTFMASSDNTQLIAYRTRYWMSDKYDWTDWTYINSGRIVEINIEEQIKTENSAYQPKVIGSIEFYANNKFRCTVAITSKFNTNLDSNLGENIKCTESMKINLESYIPANKKIITAYITGTADRLSTIVNTEIGTENPRSIWFRILRPKDAPALDETTTIFGTLIIEGELGQV